MNMFNAADTPAFFTTKELAEYLRVPLATIYAWRTKGALTPVAYFVGRHLRWSRAAVDAWLANGGSRGPVLG
jgi:excisionase family DNA binding protein